MEEERTTIDDFPDELLQLIFSSLDWRTVYQNLIYTCKLWLSLCFDANFLYLMAKKTDKRIVKVRYNLLYYSAKMGNAKAMNSLGKFIQFHRFEFDKSLNSSPSFAFSLYKQSAALHNTNALHNLGRCYQLGFGCKASEKKAMKQYLKAAELGHPSSLNNLGYIYQHGIDMEIDLKKAKEYYRLAAEKGNRSSFNNLGYLYFLEGSQSNNQKKILKAIDFFNKSANLGDLLARYTLGRIYSLDEHYDLHSAFIHFQSSIRYPPSHFQYYQIIRPSAF